MLVLFTLAGLWWSATAPFTQTPEALHCRIDLAAGAKGRRCHVTVPAGRALRPCGAADRRAGRCDAVGRGRYVAWVVGTGPGHCRIADKKTKWRRGVIYAKLSKTGDAPSTCDLYVELK